MWRAGTTWTAQINVVVENNNNFDTTNLELILKMPGISNITTYINNATTSVDTANDTGTVKLESISEAVIEQGDSKTFQLTVSYTSEFLESVIDTFSPEELAQVTDKDRTIIYGSGGGDISKKLRSLVIEHITYNLAGTPTPNCVEVAAKTIFEPGFELENFTYVYGDLRFDVEFYSYIRYDSLYVTTAKIAVTNNNQDHTVTALSFKMNHNRELSTSYINSIEGNWGSDGGGNNFTNQTNININESRTTHVIASIPNYGSIAPGQTRNYYITQILSNLKYRSFTFSDVTYSLDGVEYNPEATRNMNFLMNFNKEDLLVNNTVNENVVANDVNLNTTNTINTNTVVNENKIDNTIVEKDDSIVDKPELNVPEEKEESKEEIKNPQVNIEDNQGPMIDAEVPEDLFVNEIVQTKAEEDLKITNETKEN